MRVSIKDLNVKMELGNTGIELEIRDNDNNHLGDLILGRRTVEWCEGRTRQGNGNRTNWPELIKWLQDQ